MRRPSASARWFLIAMLTFQLSIGLQWPVAHAAAATPEGQSRGVVPEHCPGHATHTTKSASQHGCCGSSGCHCQVAPSLLAPELPSVSATHFVLPQRPAVVTSPPVARPTEPFRPPIG